MKHYAGLPVVCIETRHASAYLKAQVNKTNRNDARGIAHMMRVNLFRPVNVKTLASQKQRALLTARAASGKSHRHRKRYPRPPAQFRSQGWGCPRRQVRTAHPGARGGPAGFERTHGSSAGSPAEAARAVHQAAPETAGDCPDDTVCRRLMTIPGVGAVTALAYRATIDVPARFRNSEAVGAVLGLTPAQH